MKEKIYKVFKRYPLSIIILLTIVYLSFFKPPKISLNEIKNIDKLVHFVMYFGFCSVLWFEYMLTHAKLNLKRTFWGAIIAPVLFSGAVEVIQEYFTRHRGGDWLDFLFNSLGVFCAVLSSIFIIKPIMKKYNLLNRCQ